MRTFESKRRAADPDAIALDGSAVRILTRVPGGSTAQFELAANQVSTAVAHRTVDEIWLVTSGRGQMWRKLRDREEIVDLVPDLSLTIPVGTHFQFRSSGSESLVIVGVTMPPWPPEGDAYVVAGAWSPTVGDAVRKRAAAEPIKRELAITRTHKDHVPIASQTCGALVKVLGPRSYERLDITIASAIQMTAGHFHTGFDEIYLMMEGEITLRLYDPVADREWTQLLRPDELCVIRAGLHHKVIAGAVPNRLCVVSVPAFDNDDEHVSPHFESAAGKPAPAH